MNLEETSSAHLLDEQRLIEEAKADPKAFKILYERYFKAIFLFVLHRIGDKQQTADVTSQIFVKALVNLADYTFRGLPFSSWLYRIAINETNQFFRKTKCERLVVLDDSHVNHLYEEMFADGVEDELKSKLPLILERLKSDELQLIELRYLEGRPFRQICEMLGISETNAKVKTYRILEKMKKMFIGSYEK